MPTVFDRVRAAVAGHPREFWPKHVADGMTAGLWGWEALEALQRLQQDPAPVPGAKQRLPPKTRLARWEERPVTPTGRFVRAVSLDPVLDWSLSDGAARCLQLVVSLAGGAGRSLVTLSSSIARQIGRTKRTVQNYWNDLVEAGFITRTFDRRSGLVTVTVTEAAAPPKPATEPDRPAKPAMQWPRLPAWRRVRAGGGKMVARIKDIASSSMLGVVESAEERLLTRGVEASAGG